MTTLLIDSNFIAHQARMTMPDLQTTGEIQTGIILGFLVRILTLAERFETNRLVFVWDSKYSIRKKMYDGYKVKRHQDETEEEHDRRIKAMKQFPVIRKAMKAMGFPSYCVKGLEGDDLFASICKNNHRTFILITADEDMFQLLDGERVVIYNPSKKQMVTEQSFCEEKGIMPYQWGMVKTIGGCTSDCVPGLAGVGEGKSIQYIKGLMNPKTKTFEKIEQYLKTKEYKLFKKLVVLPLKGTPDIKLPEQWDLDFKVWKQTCEKYELQSLLFNTTKWEALFQGRFGAGIRKKIKIKKRRKGLLNA